MRRSSFDGFPSSLEREGGVTTFRFVVAASVGARLFAGARVEPDRLGTLVVLVVSSGFRFRFDAPAICFSSDFEHSIYRNGPRLTCRAQREAEALADA